jgi:hypothetical protein
VFTVIARVTFVREEADSDYHFILQEGGYHMIAETPAPYCDRLKRLEPSAGSASISLLTAILLIVVWTIVPLAAGAWRTRTRDA